MNIKKKFISFIVIVIILMILTVVKAFMINSHDLKVREERLSSNKIDSNLDGLIVCYFCDLNYGSNITNQDIENIQEPINNFKPDIILFGGDLLIDNSIDNSVVLSLMSNIKAKYGKYAVLGEEDLNNNTTKSILEESDFVILDNNNRKLYLDGSFINLVGISPNVGSDLDIITTYEGVNPNYYTITICHYPDTFERLDNSKTDYVLSGHTLGGPVYIPLVNLLYRPTNGEIYFKGKQTKDGLTLDISDGLGTKQTDVRMFSDFEVVFYKLKTK